MLGKIIFVESVAVDEHTRKRFCEELSICRSADVTTSKGTCENGNKSAKSELEITEVVDESTIL